MTLSKERLEQIANHEYHKGVAGSLMLELSVLKEMAAELLERRERDKHEPGDKTITAYFDTLALDVARDIMCDVNRRNELLGGDVQLLARIQCRIDEVCRVVMLQSFGNSEQLNSPVTPDGWIKCSEKMPDEPGRFWCYVEEQNSLGKSHYQWNCSWNGERWWIESENGGRVTHWKPLPAAPKQESE